MAGQGQAKLALDKGWAEARALGPPPQPGGRPDPDPDLGPSAPTQRPLPRAPKPPPLGSAQGSLRRPLSRASFHLSFLPPLTFLLI